MTGAATTRETPAIAALLHCCLAAMTTVVYIEGNIGAGKSTLLKRLRGVAPADVAFVQEPVDTWENAGLLQAVYDGDLSVVAFQMVVMATRHCAILHALEQRAPPRVVVVERSLASDVQCFCAVSDMTEFELRACRLASSVLHASISALVAREVHLYLDTPVPEILQRMALRARPAEAAIKPGYISQLRVRTYSNCCVLAPSHPSDVNRMPTTSSSLNCPSAPGRGFRMMRQSNTHGAL